MLFVHMIVFIVVLTNIYLHKRAFYSTLEILLSISINPILSLIEHTVFHNRQDRKCMH